MRRRKPAVWTSSSWHIQARRFRTGLISVPVTLFQMPYHFLIDSGASYSIIDQSIVDEQELPLLEAVPWFAPSGARTISPRVRAPLYIGGSGGIEIVTDALVVSLPDTFGIDGFIGADILRQFDVTIEEAMVILRQRVSMT